jgi:hypothetical protein
MRKLYSLGYEFKVDSKAQYGEKNDTRFVVYHDKNRKPYQVSKFECIRILMKELIIRAAPICWEHMEIVGEQFYNNA